MMGSSVVMGIELTSGEAQLRPKVRVECRQVDIQQGFFVAFQPREEGSQVFGMMVDGYQAKVDGNKYTMGTTWNASQLGKVMPIKFNYPRYVKQGEGEPEVNPYRKGAHRIQIMLGHMVGKSVQWDDITLPVVVNITESEFV